MRKSFTVAGAALLALVSTVAHAEGAAFVAKPGQTVYSSDNHRVGVIDRVADQRAGIIYDMRYIYVPVETLSPGEKNHVVSKLTYKEIVAR